MKKLAYIAAFIMGATIATGEPHRTVTGDCVSIKVPVSLYHDAIDAGLMEWLAAQCEVAS